MNTPTRKSNNSSLEIVIAALTASLADLRRATDIDYTGERAPNEPVFDSPRRQSARKNITEAIDSLSRDITLDPMDGLRRSDDVLREVQHAAQDPNLWAARRKYLLEHIQTVRSATHNLTCSLCGPALQRQQDDAVAAGIAAVQGASSKEFESAVVQGFTEATTPGPVQAPQTATAAKALSYYASVPRPAEVPSLAEEYRSDVLRSYMTAAGVTAPSPDAMKGALDSIREIDRIMDRMEEQTGMSVTMGDGKIIFSAR